MPNLPKEFKIESDQVVLNILQEQDAEDLYIAIQYSLANLRKFPASLPWAMHEPALEFSLDFCRSKIEAQKKKENYVFSIRLKESQHFIGVMDIHDIDWGLKTAAIGFWGNSKFKSTGYMTQALSGFVATLFQYWDFKILNAFVEVENISARKLCLRANFTVVEILYGSISNPLDGSLRDQCVYQIQNK